jgi:uncharacterized protein YjbI with pentapeptide repeats
MQFEVTNRFTGKVQFTAEIEATDDMSYSFKIGLAVKWAVKKGANLAGAYLAGANLAGANLAGAYLAGAYLADANLADAYLADADLAGADLADADLARADLAGAYLAGANLAGANLARANLADANLADANLADADLADADLAGADLADADLAGANLARANLADANLADAYLADAYLADANLAGANLAGAIKIDPADIPVIPNIDAAILTAIENGGELNMGAWHTCETTHCRAGWAVHLAGAAGKALEERVGTQMAGAMIYRASRPGKPAPWFFDTDENALADIRKCASEQISQPE